MRSSQNGLRAVDYQPADQSSRHTYEHGTPDCARGQSILTKPVYGRSSEVPPRVPSSQDRAATIAEVVSLLPVAAATLGVAGYRAFTLFAAMPFGLAALPKLRALGERGEDAWGSGTGTTKGGEPALQH